MRRVGLWLELIFLWILMPLLLMQGPFRGVRTLWVLLAGTAYAVGILWRARVPLENLGFRGSSGFAASLQGALPWLGAALPVVALVGTLDEGGGAGWAGRSAWGVGRFLLLYAAVSVTSQEFLYSSFFFWRYRPILPAGFLVPLNVLVFGAAHLLYRSWISVGLALAGRLILARTFSQWRSFWAVWILHVLLGVAVFLAGLGRHFSRLPGGP